MAELLALATTSRHEHMSTLPNVDILQSIWQCLEHPTLLEQFANMAFLNADWYRKEPV